jgi:hypothetical protein
VLTAAKRELRTVTSLATRERTNSTSSYTV